MVDIRTSIGRALHRENNGLLLSKQLTLCNHTLADVASLFVSEPQVSPCETCIFQYKQKLPQQERVLEKSNSTGEILTASRYK